MKKDNTFLLLCFCAMLSLTACKCNNKSQKNNHTDSTTFAIDSAHAIDSLAMIEDVQHFDTATQHWLFSTLNNKKIDSNNFQLNYSGDETKDLGKTVAFAPSKNFYKDYQAVLRWSPDSAHIVDFGSYSYMVIQHKDGKTSLEGGDPETKVSLINVQQQQQAQILFAGPNIQVLDVKWLNKNIFAMLYANHLNKQPDTALWLINVQNNKIRKYDYSTQ